MFLNSLLNREKLEGFRGEIFFCTFYLQSLLFQRFFVESLKEMLF